MMWWKDRWISDLRLVGNERQCSCVLDLETGVSRKHPAEPVQGQALVLFEDSLAWIEALNPAFKFGQLVTMPRLPSLLHYPLNYTVPNRDCIGLILREFNSGVS